MAKASDGPTRERIDRLESEVERLMDIVETLQEQADTTAKPPVRLVKTTKNLAGVYGAVNTDIFDATFVDVRWGPGVTGTEKKTIDRYTYGGVTGKEPPIKLYSVNGYLSEGGVYAAYSIGGRWVTLSESALSLCECRVVFDFESTDAEVVVDNILPVFGISPIANPPVDHDPVVTVCNPLGCDPLVDDPCTCRDMLATEMLVQNTMYLWNGTSGLPGHIIYHKSDGLWHFIQLRCPSAEGVSADTLVATTFSSGS